jgi:hypothetical protein
MKIDDLKLRPVDDVLVGLARRFPESAGVIARDRTATAAATLRWAALLADGAGWGDTSHNVASWLNLKADEIEKGGGQ